MEYYQLDAARYLTAPSLTWNGMLVMMLLGILLRPVDNIPLEIDCCHLGFGFRLNKLSCTRIGAYTLIYTKLGNAHVSKINPHVYLPKLEAVVEHHSLGFSRRYRNKSVLWSYRFKFYTYMITDVKNFLFLYLRLSSQK